MAETKKCEVCGKVSNKKCAKCYNAFYCGKEHQVLGWKTHKKICRPFKICSNEELGRHVVATKPIKEGDVILQELPLVLCSKRDVPPICMGCSTVVTGFNRCKECGWPLCSDKCPDKANHKPECYYAQKTGKKISWPDYQSMPTLSIMVLRCLYQKRFFLEVWEKLDELQSHCEESKKSLPLKCNERRVINDLYNTFRLEDEFTEDEIANVCGILAINSFKVSVGSPFDTGIYQTGSLFQHSCKANCYRVFSPKGTLRIVAGTEIKEGDHLSICYVDALWITPRRQWKLKISKFFVCKCERCADVTEFGTNFSALKCQKKNCEGILLPESFFTVELQWTCNKCQFKMTSKTVEEVLRPMDDKLAVMKENSSAAYDYKTFLKSNGKLLPQNHGYMVNAKLELIGKIGNTIQEGLDKVSDAQLELKTSLCREVLDVLQVVVPGEKGIRSDVLVALQNTLTEMYCRKLVAGALRPKISRGILMEQKLVLSEIIKHFHYDTPERYHAFQNNLMMVESSLADLKL